MFCDKFGLLRVRVVTCTVDGVVWRVLVDTGACRTVCSRKFAERLGLCVRTVSDSLPLYSACGRSLSVAGEVEFVVELPWRQQISVNALVMENLRPEFILGRDVIEREGWCVSVRGGG